MRDEKGFWAKFFVFGTAQCAIACGLIGALTALLLLWAGAWKTLLIVLMVAIGAFIGGVKDKKTFIQSLFGDKRRE